MKTLHLALFCALVAVSLARPQLSYEKNGPAKLSIAKLYPVTDEPEIYKSNGNGGDGDDGEGEPPVKLYSVTDKQKNAQLHTYPVVADAQKTSAALARHHKNGKSLLHVSSNGSHRLVARK